MMRACIKDSIFTTFFRNLHKWLFFTLIDKFQPSSIANTLVVN
jgi:hypothetical protein